MFKGISALEDTAELQLELEDGSPAVVATDENDIDDETGKPRQHRMTIKLLRLDSGEAQRKVRLGKNKRLHKVSRTGRMNLKQEDFDSEALDLAVFCTRGWTHFYNNDGTPVECTAATVRKLYGDRKYSWLYTQVDRFINEAANFAGNSSTS